MTTIAVDFDNTLVESNEGYLTPIRGAKEALESLKQQGFRIVIHTCRTTIGIQTENLGASVRLVEDALNSFGIPFDEIHVGEKLIADLYIDDRAIHFNGNWKVALDETYRRLSRILKSAG